MQLHTGAGGFGRDGRGAPIERLGAGDVDRDVLAARAEDRLVEGRIPRRLAHPAVVEVFGHQRGQDADHHDVGAARNGHAVGFSLGLVQAVPDFGLQVEACASKQWPGRHIEFDVVGAQFGLICRVGDGVQHIPIRHGGLIVVIDEVAFDLHAGEWPVGIKPGLLEHRF